MGADDDTQQRQQVEGLARGDDSAPQVVDGQPQVAELRLPEVDAAQRRMRKLGAAQRAALEGDAVEAGVVQRRFRQVALREAYLPQAAADRLR